MSPRPTRVQVEADQIKVVTNALEPDIRASLGEVAVVAVKVRDRAVVQTRIDEVV